MNKKNNSIKEQLINLDTDSVYNKDLNNLKDAKEKFTNFKIKDGNIYINFNGLNIDIELLESQKYKNVKIIPFKTNITDGKDFLTLKKGVKMDLVEITELENSTVNSVLCKNKAVTPLILIDGDEIIGAKQNRIINDSLLIPASTTMKINVSCTEHGRWHFNNSSDKKDHFFLSDFYLDHRTRARKSRAAYDNREYQGEIWNSINELERDFCFKSESSALHDNYNHNIEVQEEYLKHFNIVSGQNGVIFIVNGEIKGLELFYNHSLYKEYHEKILRTYIFEAIQKVDEEKDIEKEDLNKFLSYISDSEFKEKESVGLGNNLNFSNNYGSGSSLIYDDEIIHMVFFKEEEKTKVNFEDIIVDKIY